jgi:hypothetical protein
MLAERDPQWKTLVPAEVAEVYEAGMAKPEYPKLIGGPDEE